VSEDREGGAISVLVIGVMGFVLALASVVTAASAVFLTWRDLAGLCDGATLAGAQGVDVADVYRQGAAGPLPLSGPRVAGRVHAYAAARAADFTDLRVALAGVEAARVHVACTAVRPLPVLGRLGVGPRTVHADAVADEPSAG